MTIKWDCDQSGCYCKNVLPNWAMLNGCFAPYKIPLMRDVDGQSHQGGRLLQAEWKRPGQILDGPELRTARALVNQGNAFIAIWGTDNSTGSDIVGMQTFGISGFDEQRKRASLTEVREAVSAWWESVYVPGKI